MSKPPKRPRREPPTIDLKATEIRSAPPPERKEAAAPPPAEPPPAAGAPLSRSRMAGAPHTTSLPGQSASSLGAARTDAAGPGPTRAPSGGPAVRIVPPSESATAGAAPASALRTDTLDAIQEPPAAPGDEALIQTAERSRAAHGRPPDPPLAEPAPARSDPPGGPEEGRRGIGFGGLLAASLLGGVVGAGLTLLGSAYLRSGGDRTEGRLAQIEQRVGATATGEAVAGLERRIAALEPTQRTLAERVNQVQAAVAQAQRQAEDALARANAAVSAAGATPPGAGAPADPAALEGVNGRLAAIEAALQSQTQAAAEGVRGLEARLAEQAAQLAAAQKQLAEAAQQIGTIQTQAGEQGQRVAALAPQIAQQGQQLNQVSQQIVEQGRQIGQQGEKIAAAERQLADQGPAMRAGVRIVAADRLGDALREGQPFAQTLEALKRLQVEPARLTALEPFAATGAPTAAGLLQGFRPLSERILREARGPANSWTERLWRMAEGVVTVKPVAETGGTSVPALVARIEAALGRANFGDAALAFDQLPEPARALSAEWGRTLKARAAAEEAARAISSEALAALDAPSAK